jgi:glycerol-3-phosphate dehydrogenase
VLAGKYGFGRSRILSREETLERLPTLSREGLRGGVIYYDGQFDDARLLIHMVITAFEQGATVANYVRAVGMTTDPAGFVNGVVAEDGETGEKLTLPAKVVINATGPFTDSVRKMADPGCREMVAASQGAHLVFDGSFLRSDTAIMVPKTSDGRVLFVIPWHGHAVAGTTDTPIPEATLDPQAQEQEIDFILETASEYLTRPPKREDIKAVFVGIRPLVSSGDGKNTAALSRDHTVHIDQSGLLTITGGKWTTYRNMAEDTVNQAAMLAQLPDRDCVTRTLNIHGYHTNAERFEHLEVYGSDAPRVEALGAKQLHPDLPYTDGQVRWAVREEMARTVDDILSRRTRAEFLDQKAAREMTLEVARILEEEKAAL